MAIGPTSASAPQDDPSAELLLEVAGTEARARVDRLTALDGRTIAAVALAGTLLTVSTRLEALERGGLLSLGSRTAAFIALFAALWAYAWRYTPTLALSQVVADTLPEDIQWARLRVLFAYEDLADEAAFAYSRKSRRLTSALMIIVLAGLLLAASLLVTAQPVRERCRQCPSGPSVTSTTVPIPTTRAPTTTT